MSQMTSTARGGARPLSRPPTETPRLRVVTGEPLQRGAALFGILCATLLAAGLIGLLLLNTSLAQGSFLLHDLRATSDQLNDTEGALNESLDASRSPANLARMASNLGMVPVESAAFLRLSDGKVIGVSKATSGYRFVVVGLPVPDQGATQPGTGAPAPAVPQPANGIPEPAATQPVDGTPAPAATQPVDGTPAPAATQPADATPAPAATQSAMPLPLPAPTAQPTSAPDGPGSAKRAKR